MSSRVWFVVLGLAFALGGCDDSSSTTVVGGATLVGNFPGSQIIDHLLSDDSRAFNHSAAKLTKGLQVYWNGANGHAIVLYVDWWERLWAHHWNGTTFTPGVELRGANQEDLGNEDYDDDDAQNFGAFRVLFLNTSTGGRNGDALIVWTRDDAPVPGSTTDTVQNKRLYGTYFDVSEAGNATSAGDATVHYGFETMGTAIDFNNTSNDDVDAFGFVSDSLRFTHAFDDDNSENGLEWPNRFDDGSDDALTPATRSGDPTSYVWIVWSKDLRDNVGAGAGNRFQAVQFSLAQVGNAMPVQGTLGAGVIAPVAGSTIDDGTDVDDPFVVHNGCMIWRSDVTAGTIGATGVFMTRFDATGNLGTIELSQSVLDAAGMTTWTGTDPEMPLPGNVYGGDHGLTSLYAFFRTTEFPGHIAATKTDLDATFDQAAREISAIEGPGGAIVAFDGNKDAFAPETRIDRANQWIFVTWLQDTAVAQLAGLSPGVRIHMHGVQTRTSATARTLANSIVAGGPFLAPNQATPTNNPSERLFLQSEIANGMQDPRCGIQSNPNRINLAWHEGIDPLVDLKHNGLTIALSGVATTAPTAAPSVATGGLVANGNTGYNAFDSDNGLQPVVTDLGTAAGDPLIYFVNNQNNPTNPAAVGAFNEFRVFGLACIPGSAPADAQLVSTDGPNADNTMNDVMTDDDNEIDDYVEEGGQFLHVRTTPTSTAAGAHGGTRVHLFFMEARHGENSKPAFRTRYFTKSAFNPASAEASFTTAHTPSLAADPTALSGPGNDEDFLAPTVHRDDDEKGPFTPFCTAAGNTVGIYFTTSAHYWYQEFNGTSWLGAPEIIDNESEASLFYGRDQRAYIFPPMRNGTCDNLNGTLVFYSKNPPGEDPGHRREYARVHD